MRAFRGSYNKIYRFLFRNRLHITKEKPFNNGIHLEWWNKKENIGDQLANVIYAWMLDRNKVNTENIHGIKHLMTVGSIIGMEAFDAVIWGSGFHCLTTINRAYKNRKRVRYDIRALRGPITKHILSENGYDVDNCVLGDPAILMSLIYTPAEKTKKYEYSVINHLDHPNEKKESFHQINVETKDYAYFIDEIVASKCIISSSLHGIILAETYGVPAIFWNNGMNKELIKFYDWYFSTKRYDVKIAKSLEEAIKMEPMELPELDKMRDDLLKAFPYDIFS